MVRTYAQAALDGQAIDWDAELAKELERQAKEALND